MRYLTWNYIWHIYKFIFSSLDTCLVLCSNTEGCTHFNFYPDTKVCGGLDGCQFLTTEGCTNCVSGSLDKCLQCYEAGKRAKAVNCIFLTLTQCVDILGSCLGPFLGDVAAASAEDCNKICRDSEYCYWWKYHKNDQFCTLVTECFAQDESCSDCTFGFTSCKAEGVEGELDFRLSFREL